MNGWVVLCTRRGCHSQVLGPFDSELEAEQFIRDVREIGVPWGAIWALSVIPLNDKPDPPVSE